MRALRTEGDQQKFFGKSGLPGHPVDNGDWDWGPQTRHAKSSDNTDFINYMEPAITPISWTWSSAYPGRLFLCAQIVVMPNPACKLYICKKGLGATATPINVWIVCASFVELEEFRTKTTWAENIYHLACEEKVWQTVSMKKQKCSVALENHLQRKSRVHRHSPVLVVPNILFRPCYVRDTVL